MGIQIQWRVVLGCFLMSGLLMTAIPDVYGGSATYNRAVSAYRMKKNDEAVKLFTQVVKAEPDNAQAYFLLGNSLARSKKFEDARTVFETLMQRTPSSHPYHQKAKKNLALLTRVEMSANGNSAKAQQISRIQNSSASNYLSYAISRGKIMHWDPQRMPLKVHIKDGRNVRGYDFSMKATVRNAMNVWQSGTRGRVRFTLANRPDDADIIVDWKDRLEHNRVGESPFESMGDTIVRSDVTIGLHHPVNGQALGKDELFRTAIHELGHALGIQGHSPDPQDIMFYSVNPQQQNGLTSRDRNTMAMLYRLEADVTNNSGMSTAQTRGWMDIKQQAVEAHQKKQLAQAIQLYQQALRMNSRDADLWYNLGVAYDESNNGRLAGSSFRRAIAVDTQHIRARYGLSVVLINDGVEKLHQQNRSAARQLFQEAVNHLELITRSPDAPPGAQKNLQIARKNLEIVS